MLLKSYVLHTLFDTMPSILVLHWVSRSKQIHCLEVLNRFPVPWHVRNSNGQTFLDIAFSSDRSDPFHVYVKRLCHDLIADGSCDATKKWTFMQFQEKYRSEAMEELMNMDGLQKVKHEAISLFNSVMEDKKRPEKARVCPTTMYHYAFLGNPGVGEGSIVRCRRSL